jgi:hypothetical protein
MKDQPTSKEGPVAIRACLIHFIPLLAPLCDLLFPHLCHLLPELLCLLWPEVSVLELNVLLCLFPLQFAQLNMLLHDANCLNFFTDIAFHFGLKWLGVRLLLKGRAHDFFLLYLLSILIGLPLDLKVLLFSDNT